MLRVATALQRAGPTAQELDALLEDLLAAACACRHHDAHQILTRDRGHTWMLGHCPWCSCPGSWARPGPYMAPGGGL